MSILAEIGSTLASELSDLPSVAEWTRVTLRMLLAVLLGAILGFDRGRKGKSAGLRTHMLVALGAALFILVPSRAGWDEQAIASVIQGLVAGIGFLGAGAIVKNSGDKEPQGLTTAATIWLTAAIGVTVGMGREATAVLATLFAIVILAFLPSSDKLAEVKDEKD